MTLNLIKLCVGVDSVEDLADWQAGEIARLTKAGSAPLLTHVTRMTPKRGAELLDGGSLYWVVKGFTAARQPIADLIEVTRGGVPHCGIVYEPEIIPVARRAQRPFQGWRYLSPNDAPPDLTRTQADLPAELREKLAELGLL